MRSSEKSRQKGRWRKIPKCHAAALTSDPSNIPTAEKKTTPGKAAAVAQHPDTNSQVSHTAQTPAAHGHLPQNTATCSMRIPVRGRKKKTAGTACSPSPDTVHMEQQDVSVTPPPRPAHSRRSRAAKETLAHTTLSSPSSPQDTSLSSRKSDPGEGTATPQQGRPHLSSNPRRSRMPPSQPQISLKMLTEKNVHSPVPDTQKRKRTRRNVDPEMCTVPSVKRQRKKSSAKAVLPHTQRVRTRFVLEEAELREPVETLSSADLSIELSVQEEKLPLTHTLALEDEDEQEEELPSFLQQIRQKPFSIREGLCVWCKLRKFPFWPAMVKSVNRKTKKASIVFIDKFLLDKKTVCKGLWVSLRTLKPFDCEESHHFVDIAKEKGGEPIQLYLALISDYNIRIGCGSFVGSIVDYIADDISQPLRSEFSKASSELVSPTQYLMEQQNRDCEENSELFHDPQIKKKVLPDRTLAARNRANQKLVDYIVRRKGVQDRILAVIRGDQACGWLEDLRSCSRSMVEQVYLEDEEQVEAVYHYLEELWKSVAKANRHLERSDRIRYIMDILFPEALICAISAVDCISLDKAKEKYRQGPRHSNRERQAFDLMIEKQQLMKLKAADSS